jgi:ribosomal protein S14
VAREREGEQAYHVLYLQEFRRHLEQEVRLFSKEDGGYAFEISVKDRETGEWTTQIVEIPAKTFITTSAERLPSSQMLRRVWLISPDDSPELTTEANRRKAEYREGKHEPVDPRQIEVLRKAVELLEPKPVIIPYASLLLDLTAWDRTALDNLFDIISAITNLHQFQRDTDAEGRLIATLADAYMALRISWPILSQTLAKLPTRLKRCLDALTEEHRSSGKGVTAKDLALKMGLSQSTVRDYLSDLVNLGYTLEDTFERPYRYVPSGRSVECVEDLFRHSIWGKLTDFAKRTSNRAVWRSVEGLPEDDECMFVIDPITGDIMDLFTLPHSSTLLKKGENEPQSGKEGEIEDIECRTEFSAHSTLGERFKTGCERCGSTRGLVRALDGTLLCERCARDYPGDL